MLALELHEHCVGEETRCALTLEYSMEVDFQASAGIARAKQLSAGAAVRSQDRPLIKLSAFPPL